MKIATWNVNGIRARQLEVQQFVERERPDVLCLQEIKASSDQVPAALCEMERRLLAPMTAAAARNRITAVKPIARTRTRVRMSFHIHTKRFS